MFLQGLSVGEKQTSRRPPILAHNRRDTRHHVGSVSHEPPFSKDAEKNEAKLAHFLSMAETSPQAAPCVARAETEQKVPWLSREESPKARASVRRQVSKWLDLLGYNLLARPLKFHFGEFTYAFPWQQTPPSPASIIPGRYSNFRQGPDHWLIDPGSR